MSADYADGAEPEPFSKPAVPGKNELGRLVAHGVLLNGWQCRWCKQILGALWTPSRQGGPGSAVICPRCDAPSRGSVIE